MGRRRQVNLRAEASLALAATALGCLYVGRVSGLDELWVPGLVVLAPLAVAAGVAGRDRPGGYVGIWGIGLAVATFILAFFVPTMLCRADWGRIRRMQAASNLRQIGLALSDYEAEHGRLPPAIVRDSGGRPLYSWRVLILPYLGEEELYNEFRRDEPWDGPHNRRLIDKAPGLMRIVAQITCFTPGVYDNPNSRLPSRSAYRIPQNPF